ncbi:MAG: hypothetical protein QNK36_10555 [Colwellia sp.]|nr:hypothetical protein [Colwellia sp.]
MSNITYKEVKACLDIFETVEVPIDFTGFTDSQINAIERALGLEPLEEE